VIVVDDVPLGDHGDDLVPGFLAYDREFVHVQGRHLVQGLLQIVFPEDPFALDDLAREHGVTALVDCGVAPGMSNAILGYHNETMDVEVYECLVGGFPVKRSWPYQYKAPFSPIDVIEEYIRPAKFVENSEVVVKPALSDPELVEIDPLGTLEAFNTDGLRTLLRTMKVPYMKEKTMRYPGHIEYMRVLRESGFFGKEPIEVMGQTVRPIDVTARLLFPKWRLEKDEPELTVMRVTLSGREGEESKQYVYNLFDSYDEKTKVSSMARTTGYTCSAAAWLVLRGMFTRKGICPPELLGSEEGCFKRLLNYFVERDIHYDVEETTF